MKYPDGEFTFNVAATLDEFEEVWDLFDVAVRKFNPTNLRAFAARFGEVAKPELDGKPWEPGALDPNLILALGRDWVTGVRDVPLPLPERSSDGEPSEDQTPASQSPEN